MSWEDSLILEDNEKIIQFWRGDYEVQYTVFEDGLFGKEPKKAKKQKKGILVLTNRKIVFLEERGFFGKSYHACLSIKLENIEGISMGGFILKYVSISDKQNEYIFHLNRPPVATNEQFNSFKNLVYKQINLRKQELEKEKKKERIHIMLDFSFLKNYMERGGLILETVKCPECGAPVKLPEVGNYVVCEHCGNTIYAQDIFEKVKELIG